MEEEKKEDLAESQKRKQDLFKIYDIKQKTADKVREICLKMAVGSTVLIEPNSRPSNRKPKIICKVYDMETAEALKKAIEDLAAEASRQINELIKQKKPAISYNIHVIDKVLPVHGTLSKHPASSSWKVAGGQIEKDIKKITGLTIAEAKELVEAYGKILAGDTAVFVVAFDKAMQAGQIDPGVIYRITKQTGTSYRLTLYTDEGLQQVNVADICILVSSGIPVFEPNRPHRKTRSDQNTNKSIAAAGRWNLQEY